MNRALWQSRAGCLLLALILIGCGRRADDGTRTKDGRLAPLLKNMGSLSFPVTTSSTEAQQFVNQGMTLVYGFNHAEAVRSFREAARLDSRCAMAFWGEALALAPNINDPAIGEDREQQGQAAIQKAVEAAKVKTTPREQGFIDALTNRFSAAKGKDRPELNKAYASAMAAMYARFPDDPDAGILYADAVMNTMPWNYWNRNGKPNESIPEAVAAVEKAIRQSPLHPGAHHLYIHLMEASKNPDAAVPSADRLGGLAPAAGHLVHMPSHIYLRVGRYEDAVTANIKATAADEDYISQCRAQGIYPMAYYPHNIHMLHAALMMEGRSVEAMEAARKVASKHSGEAMHMPGFGFPHLLRTMPEITMVRFRQWDDMLATPAPPVDEVYGRAMHHFARGMAFAAKGDVTAGDEELKSLEKAAADPTLKELKILDVNSLAALAEISAGILKGELALARKNYAASLAAYRKAVEAEDALTYSEPPDWALPARQFLGQALLKAGRAREAERVFREDLEQHRNNGWSLAGLQQSLLAQGKQKEAEAAGKALRQSWARSDQQSSGPKL